MVAHSNPSKGRQRQAEFEVCLVHRLSFKTAREKPCLEKPNQTKQKQINQFPTQRENLVINHNALFLPVIKIVIINCSKIQ